MEGRWKDDRARILVVDDDERAREILVEFLKLEGFRVESAADGGRAWRILMADPLFDMVITDLNMPLIDGLDLLGRIRQRSLPVKTVLLTNYPGPEVATRARQLGVAAVLAKPFGVAELLGTVERVMARRACSRGGGENTGGGGAAG